MYIPITFFVSRRLVMGLSPVHAAAAAAAGADDDDDSVYTPNRSRRGTNSVVPGVVSC